MTSFTVGDNHFLRVRCVALGTLRDLAVYRVTGYTVKGTMPARIVLELGNLLRVAGDTRICYPACRRHMQRRMCAHVTAEAVLQFEMGLSLMALDTLRDLAMDRVTGSTVNRAVPALIVPELGILLRVAGKTNTLVC